MDSGTAALLGAGIGFLGSIAGTLVAPLIIGTFQSRQKEQRATRDALRRIVPSIIESSARLMSGSADSLELSKALRFEAELELMLKPEEWQIGRIAMMSVLPAPSAEAVPAKQHAALSLILGSWMRGEISSAKAAENFEKITGERVERIIKPESSN